MVMIGNLLIVLQDDFVSSATMPCCRTPEQKFINKTKLNSQRNKTICVQLLIDVKTFSVNQHLECFSTVD